VKPYDTHTGSTFTDVKYLPILLLMFSCASEPLTEEQREEREYVEQDRKNRYVVWEKNCRGVIFSNNASRLPRKGIPDKWDWRWDEKRDRPALGNRVQCLSPAQMRQVLEDLMR